MFVRSSHFIRFESGMVRNRKTYVGYTILSINRNLSGGKAIDDIPNTTATSYTSLDDVPGVKTEVCN